MIATSTAASRVFDDDDDDDLVIEAEPSPEQLAACDVIVRAVPAGGISTLTGPGGTGKTRTLKPLVKRLTSIYGEVFCAAPTWSACQQLRKRKINASTVKSLTSEPVFQPCVKEVLDLLERPTVSDDAVVQRLDSTRMFALAGDSGRRAVALAAVRLGREKPKGGEDEGIGGDVRRMWAKLGIDLMRDCLIGWQPKKGIVARNPERVDNVLVIDEASMLDRDDLATCCAIFGAVVLVGDPHQLPPVVGEGEPAGSALDDALASKFIPHAYLTTDHRLAADAPDASRRLAKFVGMVRDGGGVFGRDNEHHRSPKASVGDGPVQFVTACPKVFDLLATGAPMLVLSNATRIQVNTAFRKSRYFPKGVPVAGEPIMFKETLKSREAFGSGPGEFVKMGFDVTNNQLAHVHSVDADDRSVNVWSDAWMFVVTPTMNLRPDIDYITRSVDGVAVCFALLNFVPWFEDEHPHDRPSASVIVRFAYANTVHSAQGAEFNTVLIDLASAAQVGSFTRDDPSYPRKWLYTAVSRAKRRIVIVADLDRYCTIHLNTPKPARRPVGLTRQVRGRGAR